MNTLLFIGYALLHGRLAALEFLGRRSPGSGRLRIGARRAILLSTPELVEEVLVQRTDEFQKGPALRVYSRPLLGNGILSSEGETHRKHRRLVAPAFAHQRVSRYADVMSAMARQTCHAWPAGGVISMHREMTRLTLGIVGRTLFDADLLQDADAIGSRITELIRYATDQTRSFRPVPLEKDTPQNRRARESVEKLNQTIYGMIEQRRASAEDKGDLLSMLLLARDEEGGSLSDEQVRDEAMTLFVAGHETTANATTWSLYLLARNPDVQRALREQVRAAVGMRAITFADLPKLPLALEIFKESMRLYPPAYIVVREPLKDLEVGDGIKVKKGELIAMCEWVLHRDPRYFPDPLRFDPSRFSPENEPKIPRYAYFPFGGGRRICIGNQFALMEGQIILATVAQYCTLEMVGPKAVHGDPLMTLRPDGAVMMRVGSQQ
jgi:cytochrome P450